MLVIPAGNTASAQVKGAPQRPERCPLCEVIGQMIGNGYYPRKPLDLTGNLLQLIRIHRWLCRACRHTTSMLPDCLPRYRQYVWAVIAAVLLRRFGRGQTWVQIQAELSTLPADAPLAPSLDSLRRWGQAFASHAQRWLQALLLVLASVWPQLAQLNVHGARPLPIPQQLLQALAALAGWLSPVHGASTTPTVDDLRAVWRWGWNHGLGRLV